MPDRPLVITGRVRKRHGRWCVSILANAKVMQHSDDGWDTWEEAFQCAHSLVRSWRADRQRRGLA